MSAATSQQWRPGFVKSSEEEDRWGHHKHEKSRHRTHELLWRDTSQYYRNRKAGPANPDFKHKVIKEPIHEWYTPSWVDEELRRRGMPVLTQAHHVEICEKNEQVIYGKARLCNDESTSFMTLLRACGKNRDLYRGICVHEDILQMGLLEKCSDALVTMYAKCGALKKARELLDMHPSRNIFVWTALIAGYARHGQGQNALRYFERMQHEGLSPDAVTFACILRVCGSIKATDKGQQIHDQIARQRLLENNIVLGNVLVDMYVKCGALTKARCVLEELPSRDVVSWNALISGYAQEGQGEQALICFDRMQHEGLSPNAVTFTCILKACGSMKASDKGEQIHDEIARQGLLRNDIVLGNALVDMYAKCGALVKAQHVLEKLPFRDVISWSALIAGYAQEGQGEQALMCFERMRQDGLSPNAVTFACILKACGLIGAAEKGEQIHNEIAKQGLLGNNIVLGTALVDMYAKCGAVTKARRVLEKLPARNVVSWSALIMGYVQQGQGEQALICFEQMQREGLSPNAVTFACILKACGTLGAVDKGENIYDEITRQGLLGNDIVLGNALVDMYVKCGVLTKAQRVLEELPTRNVISWNTLIAGYAQYGQSEQALNCLEQMQHDGLPPNAVTFSCMLHACGHSGLVEDGHMYFVNMSTKYGMKPHLEHYTCMVNLFGRAGHLDKAVRVIQEMPSSGYSAVWFALLGACQKWGDVNVGRWAFEQAVQVDRSDATAYVLMANIYAAAGMEEDAEIIEAMRMENKAWKRKGLGGFV